MSASTLSSAQRDDLAAMYERHGDKNAAEAKRLLRLYVEWDALLWSNLIHRDPVEATLAAAVIEHGCYEWRAPGKIDALAGLHPGQRILAALREHLGPEGDPYAAREAIEADVCCPADLPAVLAVLRIIDRVELPAVPECRLKYDQGSSVLLFQGEELSGCEAARRIRNGDRTLALALLDTGQLPPATLSLAREIAKRCNRKLAFGPIEGLADLPGEMGALVSYAYQRQVSKWDDLERYAYSHFARLGRVLGLDEAPTLTPDVGLISRIRIDEEAARAYDERLLLDAEDRADQDVEEKGYSEEKANRLAANYVMKGWDEFLRYLERGTQYGAEIWAWPKGIALDKGPPRKYQGVRADLCPRPEVYRLLLAYAPSLAAGEDFGRLALVQLVSAARASAVLTIERSCVIPVKEGLVVHVRAPGNKKGRATLLIESSWVGLYGIDPDWFSEKAPANPPERDRKRLAGTIHQMCHSFEKITGIDIPRRNAGFTRPAYLQMTRPDLKGLDREAATAKLGQKSERSRGSYFRPYAEDVRTAHGPNWRKDR